MSQDLVEIAKVGSTYKLDGELNLYSLANSIETLLGYGEWYIQLLGQKSWRLLSDENVFRRADKLYIKISGVNDMNSAKQYVNALIGVPRDALPSLGSDETYFIDLVGCMVTNANGDSFGKVVDVIETGANEVLICKNGDDEYLIPYTKQCIITEDIVGKALLIDWEYDY